MASSISRSGFLRVATFPLFATRLAESQSTNTRAECVITGVSLSSVFLFVNGCYHAYWRMSRKV